ncbi:hypothetical protein GCK72_012863 [Caenorhabditis remanei]|uniref:Sdz-33 F-box domain-containing protein n=1 Tax=Caenorhabditis remanei TaxID=31234 RepID=A0A6A5GM47_CAERE|nr:hypothetical protein GCK72_012863 [Caenorhabditis remanei]KAF1756410.1 hypothetical protein GCK72_012863 [Caenorhabditis remanei]
MKPFRLLLLPHLVFRKIASQIDLLALSLCSKNSRLAVKLSGIKPIRLSKQHISTSHSVILEFDHYWILWLLKTRKAVADVEKTFSTEFKIGEQIFKTRFNGNHDVLTSLCTDYYSAADQIVEYLKNTFNCELTRYIVSREGYPEYRQLITQTINNSKNCELVFGESGQKVNAEDIDFLFNNLKTDKMLRVSRRICENYQLQNPLTFPSFYVYDAPWFRPEDLFNANCEHLTILHAPKLKPSHINLYLKQWINGEHLRILFLRIETMWLYSVLPERNQQLFDGIQLKPFDMRREKSSYKKSAFFDLLGNQFRNHQSWDIHRNDGTVGSIALNSDGCLFHVWRLK